MSKWPHPIHAVIFDNDGVLLDTIHIYRSASSELAGREYTKDLGHLTNGKTDVDVCKILIETFGIKDITPEQFAQKRSRILLNTLPNCEVIPGVERIVLGVKERNMPMGVATSASRLLHDAKVQNHKELFSLFDYVLCGDEVTQAKPSPEIFQKVSAHLGQFKPENVLVFEDAFNGVKAANAAGMPCVMVNHEIKNFADPTTVPTIKVDHFDEFDFSWFNWQRI